jgi:hypothetical protein
MLALYLLSERAAEGPDTSLAWILLVGLGLLFLMIVIGWLSSSVKQNQPEAQNEAQKPGAKK